MAFVELLDVQKSDLSPYADTAEALFSLGMMYSTGTEVEHNLISAHKWFNLAAFKGSKEAKIYREEISEEMTAEEIAEAQRQAREWLRK